MNTILRKSVSFAAVFLAGPLLVAQESRTAFDWNAMIGRGINLGNALEAPTEGEWGVRLEADYFKLIADAGFYSVRIPIRWSAHAEKEAPYTIDPAFFERVDWAVEQAMANQLVAFINIHHYEELMENPEGERERFLVIWKQIAEHYRNAPQAVYFEVLNEPTISGDVWNGLFADALAVIRKQHPERPVIVGPVGWNNIKDLDKLELPEDDRNLIVTVHYYSPFGFTHQGAEWVERIPNTGAKWQGTAKQVQAIAKDFDKAAAWAKKHDRPMNVGEFGAYEKGDMASRARWTAAARAAAEERGMSWNYWEFCAGFGAYDPDAKQWREPLLKSLIPETP